MVEAWRAAAAQYTDEELALILGFQTQLEQIMRDRLVELRGGGAVCREVREPGPRPFRYGQTPVYLRHDRPAAGADWVP